MAANMNHPKVIWNSAIRQWFCTRCGRVSDHVSEQDGHVELNQYECQIPYVECSAIASDEETVRS